MTLPQLHLATWDEIESKVEEYRNVFKDLNNYLFIDYETFYSDEYSLRKKDMTYLKFIRHEFFKIQSAFIKRGDGEGVYLRTAGDIEEYLKQQLEEYPDTIICAQQVFFDGGIIRYFHNLEFKYALDLPSMSRSIWPNDMFHNLDAIAERLWPDDQSKRKSDDIAFTKGVYNWSEEIHERNYLYNKQDTELLAEIVLHFVNNGFPIDVLVQHSIILMMYLKPRFKGNKALLEQHLKETIEDQEEKLSAAIAYIKENSQLRGAFFVTTEERNKEKFKTQKSYDEAYRAVFGMPPMKTKKDLRLMLSSNDKFAMVLKKGFGIDPPMKPSPSKPDEFTYAFGKNDVEFQQLMALHRDLKVIWEGRMVSKSNQERTRTETFLEYMDLCDGFIPVPLRPSAAHTHRLGGTEAINMQNLGRNSPLRHALTGGGTHAVNATDSSNIESRMSAVFCGHTEKVELFVNNGDPYNDMATTIYGYEVDRKSKTVDHKMQGAVGKATDLGCFAEGTAILTDAGVMPIEQVRTCNNVWNGVEWVSHKGPICKGMKNVVNIGNTGIYATPEHLIWVDDYPKQAFTATEREIQIAAQRERTEFRHIDSDFQRMYPEKWEQIVANAVFWMQSAEMEAELPVGLMPELSYFKEELKRRTKSMGRTLRLNEAAMQQSIGHELSELRRTWNSIELQIEEALHRLCDEDLRETTTKNASGQDTKRWTLRAGKLTACIERGKQSEQTDKYVYVLQWGASAEKACVSRGSNAVPRDITGRENYTADGDEGQEESGGNTRVLLWPSDLHKKQTYDIADCEKGNRFALSNGLVVKNCGYQMGEGRFRSYLNSGPLGMPPIYLEDLPEFANMANPYKYIIDVYREKNWPIKDMWWKLQNMLSEMQYHYCDEEVGGFVRFTHECIWLPSGLRLHYPDLHKSKEGTMYRSSDGWNFIFGGKVLENIIQALSAVIILRQMVWVAAYLEIVYTWEQAAPALQVHDEIVSVFPINEEYEVVDGEAVWKKDGQVRKTEEDLCAIMHRRPDSFEAVPIAAEGGTDLRYSK